MNSLIFIRGQSTHQNKLDHEFDPLVAKPKPETDWVALNTPKNYFQQNGDLISFHRLLKRAAKVVTDKVFCLLAGNIPQQTTTPLEPSKNPLLAQPKVSPLKPRAYAPSGHLKQQLQSTKQAPVTQPFQLQQSIKKPALPKPELTVGVLVDLSPGSEHKSPYPNSQKLLTLFQRKSHREQEFKKMVSEMKNLEKHIQKQGWYQELMEVFPAKGTTSIQT